MELIAKVLNEVGKPLSPEEIWKIAVERGYDLTLGSKGKTPWRTIGAQLYVEIRDNPDSPFIKAGTRPTRFSLKELASDLETSTLQPNVPGLSPKTHYKERELHPLLAYYAFTYLQTYVKTIYHERSKKSSFNKWLHPDMVGCYFPIDEWEQEVLDFGLVTGSSGIRLYSFELKTELNFSNLRESFFQTVSNSSWANEAYLVAAEISKDDEFDYELKRLSTAFGVGVIKLDICDPDSSEVVFPASTKAEIDWETANKLARENRDFREFLRRVTNDISSKEVRKERYDAIHDTQQLIALFKD